MTDTENPTLVETKKPEPISLVIGSNQGHARRHAETRGLPKAAAIAINEPLPDITKNQTILLARPTGDRAANWDDIESRLDEIGCTIETDTTG